MAEEMADKINWSVELYYAAKKGNVFQMKECLQNGAYINYQVIFNLFILSFILFFFFE